MSAEATSPEALAENAIRAFTLGRAAGVNKYAELLTRFGRGDLQTMDFAQESVKLAVAESFKYAQDAAGLGSVFIAALAKLGQPSPASAQTKRAAPAAKRRPRARPKR